jgi:hypothetical protein
MAKKRSNPETLRRLASLQNLVGRSSVAEIMKVGRELALYDDPDISRIGFALVKLAEHEQTH